eukprot:TRINITY_DN689_c3_g2_i1.p1 TRINITY_DN689_c3_g2~~TRINITY_DN689_c3_g2_i1.p1  ORF type:complete len:1332 (+),score=436.19 TRINITY_DN689_c3_g2_i1:77-4072(+)
MSKKVDNNTKEVTTPANSSASSKFPNIINVKKAKKLKKNGKSEDDNHQGENEPEKSSKKKKKKSLNLGNGGEDPKHRKRSFSLTLSALPKTTKQRFQNKLKRGEHLFSILALEATRNMFFKALDKPNNKSMINYMCHETRMNLLIDSILCKELDLKEDLDYMESVSETINTYRGDKHDTDSEDELEASVEEDRASKKKRQKDRKLKIMMKLVTQHCQWASNILVNHPNATAYLMNFLCSHKDYETESSYPYLERVFSFFKEKRNLLSSIYFTKGPVVNNSLPTIQSTTVNDFVYHKSQSVSSPSILNPSSINNFVQTMVNSPLTSYSSPPPSHIIQPNQETNQTESAPPLPANPSPNPSTYKPSVKKSPNSSPSSSATSLFKNTSLIPPSSRPSSTLHVPGTTSPSSSTNTTSINVLFGNQYTNCNPSITIFFPHKNILKRKKHTKKPKKKLDSISEKPSSTSSPSSPSNTSDDCLNSYDDSKSPRIVIDDMTEKGGEMDGEDEEINVFPTNLPTLPSSPSLSMIDDQLDSIFQTSLVGSMPSPNSSVSMFKGVVIDEISEQDNHTIDTDRALTSSLSFAPEIAKPTSIVTESLSLSDDDDEDYEIEERTKIIVDDLSNDTPPIPESLNNIDEVENDDVYKDTNNNDNNSIDNNNEDQLATSSSDLHHHHDDHDDDHHQNHDDQHQTTQNSSDTDSDSKSNENLPSITEKIPSSGSEERVGQDDDDDDDEDVVVGEGGLGKGTGSDAVSTKERQQQQQQQQQQHHPLEKKQHRKFSKENKIPVDVTKLPNNSKYFVILLKQILSHRKEDLLIFLNQDSVLHGLKSSDTSSSGDNNNSNSNNNNSCITPLFIEEATQYVDISTLLANIFLVEISYYPGFPNYFNVNSNNLLNNKVINSVNHHLGRTSPLRFRPSSPSSSSGSSSAKGTTAANIESLRSKLYWFKNNSVLEKFCDHLINVSKSRRTLLSHTTSSSVIDFPTTSSGLNGSPTSSVSSLSASASNPSASSSSFVPYLSIAGFPHFFDTVFKGLQPNATTNMLNSSGTNATRSNASNQTNQNNNNNNVSEKPNNNNSTNTQDSTNNNNNNNVVKLNASQVYQIYDVLFTVINHPGMIRCILDLLVEVDTSTDALSLIFVIWFNLKHLATEQGVGKDLLTTFINSTKSNLELLISGLESPYAIISFNCLTLLHQLLVKEYLTKPIKYTFPTIVNVLFKYPNRNVYQNLFISLITFIFTNSGSQEPKWLIHLREYVVKTSSLLSTIITLYNTHEGNKKKIPCCGILGKILMVIPKMYKSDELCKIEDVIADKPPPKIERPEGERKPRKKKKDIHKDKD